MAWVYLVIAGMFEIIFAISLKYTEGFTKVLPTIATIGGGAVSFWLLSLSLKTLPVGSAYAIWTGIGALGTVIIGMLFLGESRDLLKMVFVLCLLVGIVGLKITSSH
jgi:quaternary ammonium compound-resistance protein SugE